MNYLKVINRWAGCLTALLALSKVFCAGSWSWWWVLSPALMLYATLLLFVGGAFVVAVLFDHNSRRYGD